MPAAANNEPFRHPCVESCGRFRAGSEDHASAWRLPDGFFGWCLDAGDERRRVRPGTRPGTRKGWTTGASRSAGRPGRQPPPAMARPAAPPAMARPAAPAFHPPAMPQRPAMAPHPAPHIASPPPRPTPHFAAPPPRAAPHVAAPRPEFHRPPAAPQRPAMAPRPTPHIAAPSRPKRTAGRERAAGTHRARCFRANPRNARPHRPLAAARTAIAVAKARRRRAQHSSSGCAVAEPPA